MSKEIRIATFFDTGIAVARQGIYVIPCKYVESCFYQVRLDFCASKSGSIVWKFIWELGKLMMAGAHFDDRRA